MGIRETLCRSLDKNFVRAARYQDKTACRNLQLFVVHEAGIEGETHFMVQRLRERTYKIR